MEIKKIGVVGAGQMGSGIAEVVIVSGFSVVVSDVNEEAVQRGKDRIVSDSERQVKRQKMTVNEKEKVLARLSTVTRIDELTDCDFIIEAAAEQVPLKGEIFRALDEMTQNNIVLASNTSSIAITRIASFTKKPDLVGGMHFFNPAPVMQLMRWSGFKDLGRNISKDKGPFIETRQNPH